MPATGNGALVALKRQQYRTLDLAGANSFADIEDQMRAVARALGHPERAETQLAAMDARLSRLGRPGRGRVAAYYQRRGYLTGQDTLVDDLMRRVGLINLAQRLDKPPLASVSLEEMVVARPDFIIMEAASARVTDQGTEMLHHPALRDIPRIYVPEAWTVCGGPAYVQAAETLATQIHAADGR
jgi:iron complex transport system substrate-binding protein